MQARSMVSGRRARCRCCIVIVTPPLPLCADSLPLTARLKLPAGSGSSLWWRVAKYCQSPAVCFCYCFCWHCAAAAPTAVPPTAINSVGTANSVAAAAMLLLLLLLLLRQPVLLLLLPLLRLVLLLTGSAGLPRAGRRRISAQPHPSRTLAPLRSDEVSCLAVSRWCACMAANFRQNTPYREVAPRGRPSGLVS